MGEVMVIQHRPGSGRSADGTKLLISAPTYSRQLVLSITASAGTFCVSVIPWALFVCGTSNGPWHDVVANPLTIWVMGNALWVLSAGGRIVLGEMVYRLRCVLVLPVLNDLSERETGTGEPSAPAMAVRRIPD
ncbi:hypothetical protein [Nocardia sp. NPDC060259]|uniref:hypothetical protein n=1 Tax=Nocardia sp. NPDC060259 TaxID=3347088 RepID=UPI00364ED154